MIDQEYFKNRIKKYLADFIKVEGLGDSLLNIFAKQIFVIYQAIIELKDSYWTGQGLRLTAKAYSTLHRTSATDTDIQGRVQNIYNILSNRGTEAGIEDDLNNLYVELNPTLEFINTGTGWVIDETFPDDNIVFLDAHKLIKLNMGLPFTIGHAIIGETRIGETMIQPDHCTRKKVERMIIPIDCKIIYN